MNEGDLQHGAFSWSELMTTDVGAAKTFYGPLFGWTFAEVPAGEMPYTLIKVGDREIGGLMPTPPTAQGMPPTWGVYVTVDDVDATAARVPTLGGSVLVPPTDIPNVGRFCVLMDPQGAAITAITYTRR